MSKLEEFLTKEKINHAQLKAASKRAEKLRHEDRAVKLAKKKVAGGKATDAQKELATKQRRSGKKLASATINKALAGKPLSKHAKKRLTRAVNAVLTQKKKAEVGVGDLF